MTLSALAAFWAVSILFVITPGVDWAYAISAGLAGRVVVPAVSGMLLGHLAVTLLVAAGVGGLIAGQPLALTALTVAGASYLMWLGIGTFTRPATPQAGMTQPSLGWRRWTLKGACVSGLNPKVFLLFLALLPQFIDPTAAWPMPLQIVALGLVHIASCAVIYLLVGLGAQRVLHTRPVAAVMVSRFSGAAMVIIALMLLAEQFLDT